MEKGGPCPVMTCSARVPASPGGQTPLYELGALDDEFEPMFGQLAEFPP